MDAALPTHSDDRSGAWVVVFVLCSVGLHLLAFASLSRFAQREEAASHPPIELEVVEVQRPPPPPPEPKKEEPPKPRPRPPIKVAVTKAPPPPKQDAPPPPNDTPPKPPDKPVPLVVGISMSSTTTAGSFSAPVGNTTYGKVADKAQDPTSVGAYVAPKYVPVYQLDRQPEVLHEEKVPVPDEARQAGIEGTVVALVSIDGQGNVTEVKVVEGPGYGMNEAAKKALAKFKFRPATKNGAPVPTQIRFSYVFELD